MYLLPQGPLASGPPAEPVIIAQVVGRVHILSYAMNLDLNQVIALQLQGGVFRRGFIPSTTTAALLHGR